MAIMEIGPAHVPDQYPLGVVGIAERYAIEVPDLPEAPVTEQSVDWPDWHEGQGGKLPDAPPSEPNTDLAAMHILPIQGPNLLTVAERSAVAYPPELPKQVSPSEELPKRNRSGSKGPGISPSVQNAAEIALRYADRPDGQMNGGSETYNTKINLQIRHSSHDDKLDAIDTARRAAAAAREKYSSGSSVGYIPRKSWDRRPPVEGELSNEHVQGVLDDMATQSLVDSRVLSSATQRRLFPRPAVDEQEQASIGTPFAIEAYHEVEVLDETSPAELPEIIVNDETTELASVVDLENSDTTINNHGTAPVQPITRRQLLDQRRATEQGGQPNLNSKVGLIRRSARALLSKILPRPQARHVR